ncbi:YciI family protein [Nonomuraea antimicrobica]|uniref:YciI family protein n=1 Tax=Nonomuraea antimicrobica TaxID=561173 RepID=A0ABP7AYR6_9ACTN
MQYALLVYDEPGYLDALSDEEREAAYAEYFALADDERYLGGAQLRSAETATSVRVVNGRTLMTDGPFADTKEVLGGFCLIEAADLDEAIELAARIPAARLGGVVEVRPVGLGPAGIKPAVIGTGR